MMWEKNVWKNTVYFSVWLISLAGKLCIADELPTCLPRDYHYEFTECDESGGRWRVSVPKPGTCVGGAPNPPTRVNDCRISCDAGTYFNRTTLECLSCPPGTFSLGGGVKFDSWDHLPPGFHVSVESFESSFRLLHNFVSESGVGVNCSEFGWKPTKSFISSHGGPCAATLTYSVELVKPGVLSYTYQYTDPSILFNFEAQNDQCQSIEDVEKYKWPRTTEEAKWRTSTVQLKAGLNVLYWKTVGMGFSEKMRKPKPIRIKKIEISGVAYTSECSPCASGSYSSLGSKLCTPCPENTYSVSGSSDCSSCDSVTQYSPRGSSKCLDRPPCRKQDYYEVHTPCDEMKTTQLIYKWVEPKICRDDVPDSVSLPIYSDRIPCPPCNPGMEYANQSMCAFCEKDHFSDGSEPCRPCPPSTAPNYGLFFQWWPEIPPGMYSRCMSLEEGGCMSNVVWQPSGDHIRTTSGQSIDAYLILSLDVPGFRTKEKIINGQVAEIGTISFTFELICSQACVFAFMMSSNRKPVTEIQSWSGRTAKQHFSYDIIADDSYTFNWVFQKLGIGENASIESIQNDVAKIYDITVLNTISGGASECQPCPQGMETQGLLNRCIPCPPGYYMKNSNGLECFPCPYNTFLWKAVPEGPESCKSCGPGLRSEDGQRCYSDCRVYLFDGTIFDLTTLPMFTEVRGSPLFTASGTQYFHVFNISLCGSSGKPVAMCKNNVTYHSLDPQTEEMVNSFICRATVVPSQSSESRDPLVTQSVSLGDTLVGITTKHKLGNIEVVDEFVESAEGQSDIHFFYSSTEKTQACSEGRTTTITLRCDSTMEGNGVISPPSSCSDGTCNGCNFHFLWKTRLACRVCTESDYQIVRGECLNGKQTLHYISPQGCILPNGSPEDTFRKTIPCTMIPKQLQLVIGAGVGLGVLLLVMVVYFWKKNRKLEFKYMKLIQSSSSKDGELPAVESCGIEGDEEEQSVGVEFSDEKKPLKKSLLDFGKFRTIRIGNNKEFEWEETEALEGSWTPAN
ncbi:endosome/lysosome-associated apoptosis and autophagy regulator family member 2 isoform X1 [Parasteatoda tepidariorum]|uniref:endosome/lysosome-associated apoptosis and autophagy regulator family member 2 isoform X1 n=1 Tax=Parasteatoda tepidariorum TaxID=114398 RepID=UPI000A2C0DC8|nr:endosome/lysosome-associated apoptosis and autophagy regulator family member 2 isoform X1 [Parasteatoda tepidariorum]